MSSLVIPSLLLIVFSASANVFVVDVFLYSVATIVVIGLTDLNRLLFVVVSILDLSTMHDNWVIISSSVFISLQSSFVLISNIVG